jgi:hypothetical protein
LRWRDWTGIERFQELYAARDYPGALVEAQKYEAVVKAQLGTSHPNYGLALNALGVVCESLGTIGGPRVGNGRASPANVCGQRTTVRD